MTGIKAGSLPIEHFAGAAHVTGDDGLYYILNELAERSRIIHEPIATAVDATTAPGKGPNKILLNEVVIGLEFALADDVAYRLIKVQRTHVEGGNASLHVHWTKSGDNDESGKNVKWRLRWHEFDGATQDVNVTPNEAFLIDTYEDAGTTSRIVYRTSSVDVVLTPNYYLAIALDVDAAGTTLTSNPVCVSADLLIERSINK